MKIDFNNVRKQAIITYDRLCNKLNQAIQDKSFSPSIVIDPLHIQEDMDDLRMQLAAIGLSYLKDDPDVADVYSGMESMKEFNPES